MMLKGVFCVPLNNKKRWGGVSLRGCGVVMTFIFVMLNATMAFAEGSCLLSIDEWKELEKMPVSSLLEKARDFYETEPDSAIVYYTAASNGYTHSLSEGDKKACLMAVLERWELAFFHYFDYTGAFESLAKAKDIADDMNCREARIDLYYGCMYHTVYEQTDDVATGHKALDYFKKAYATAIDMNDILVIHMSFGNIVEVASSLGCIDSAILSDMEKQYRMVADTTKWAGREYNLGLYDAACNEAKKDFGESAQTYKRMIESADKLGSSRYKYAALQGLINANMKMGNYHDALNHSREAQKLANGPDMRDALLMCHRTIAECYDSLGNKELAKESMMNYVMLKDSLLNYAQISSIKSSEFSEQIRKYDQTLDEMRYKRFRQQLLLCLTGTVLLTVAIGWIKLRRKNQVLEATNKSLYRKNQELFQLEAEYQRRYCMKNIEPKDEMARYKCSPVTDEMRGELWASIINTLNNTPEIYNADFTLDRLAELCNSKPKYVSQVINENGDNFKTMINNQRITQACRRLTDSMNNLTIEAVANEVGFKSVNAFRASFKRVTGLTPSDYVRIAREESHCDD